MTMATDGPVISGLAYTVTEVDGHPPTGLAGCLGDRTLTLAGTRPVQRGTRRRTATAAATETANTDR
jgi:hypothetical protein